MIGITSNTEIINYGIEYHDNSADRSLVYYYDGGGWFAERGYNKLLKIQDGIKRWSNHIITVKVDCIDWKLTFMRNDKSLGDPIKIEDRDQYYPFIGVWHQNVEYELVSCTVYGT